jgi:hypothetical protein
VWVTLRGSSGGSRDEATWVTDAKLSGCKCDQTCVGLLVDQPRLCPLCPLC